MGGCCISRLSSGEQTQPETESLPEVNQAERQQVVTQQGKLVDQFLDESVPVDMNTGMSVAQVDTTGQDSPRQETVDGVEELDDHAASTHQRETLDVTHDEVASSTATQRILLAFSNMMTCLSPKLFNPWALEGDLGIMEVRQRRNLEEDDMSTKSSLRIRANAANYYDCKEVRRVGGQMVTIAQCCLTSCKGDHNKVRAAHLLPRSSTPSWIKALGLHLVTEGVNNYRNIIFLAVNIEQAFDRQRLCFVVQDGDDERKRFRLKILDPTVEHVPIHDGAKDTIGKYKGRPLHFPNGKDPFTRVLKLHARLSFAHAKKWGGYRKTKRLTHTDPRPGIRCLLRVLSNPIPSSRLKIFDMAHQNLK